MNSTQENTSSLKEESIHQDVNKDLASYVNRLGNPVSSILLHISCSIFSIPHIDGIIGYQIFYGCAVVIGDPICLPENIAEMTDAFHLFCQKCNLKIIYLLVSDSFAHWAIKNQCQSLIQVGNELIIDPTQFKIKQKLRWKINQSIQQKVLIREYKDFDPFLEKQMKNLVESWLKAKQGPQVYLGDPRSIFTHEKGWIFYALQNNNIVGLLQLSPCKRFNGWVLNFYFADAHAPVGTTEHLMKETIETLSKENCCFFCLGVISGSELGEVIGLSYPAKFMAHLILKISRWIFKLEAKKIYLDKYSPSLLPTYLLFSEKISISQLLAIKKALNVKFINNYKK